MSFFITDALAEGTPAAQGNPMLSLIFFGGMIVIFYFLLIRPQQKKTKEHRKMVEAIGKGDEIVTNGGLIGKITDVGEEYVTVELGDNVKVRLQKSAVMMVLPKGTIKAAAK